MSQAAHPSDALRTSVSERLVSVLGLDAAPMRVLPVEVWPSEGQCFVDGRRLDLSPREFEVLVALVAAAGHVVSRERLYEVIWGQLIPSRRRDVDVYIRKLRVRLAESAPRRSFIHTHNKFGYRFAREEVGDVVDG